MSKKILHNFLFKVREKTHLSETKIIIIFELLKIIEVQNISLTFSPNRIKKILSTFFTGLNFR
jgi:hypothetical protein